MTEKRFSIKEGSSIGLSSIYTDNGKVMTQLEVLDVLIKQHETIQTLTKENEQLKSENETYKNMFFEIVETALTDTNCRELYCKGVLDIFDKANSLNQAREMIKGHLK